MKNAGKPPMDRGLSDFLDRFTDREKGTLKRGFQNLEGMKELNRYLRSPWKNYGVIHIAGSKGKGSTAHMTASILEKAGYRTGLFTSPHIGHIRERIHVNGESIGEEDYERLMGELSRLVDPDGCPGASFFDLFTMAALLFFYREGCDYAVLETGLGGLYDSTNIVEPVASVITTVEREHRALLGPALEDIARHKAGIIKPGVPVFTGVSDRRVLKVIEERAQAMGSPLFKIDRKGSQVIAGDLSGSEFQWENEAFYLSLPGRHQVDNALLAIRTLRFLIPSLSLSAVRNGLACLDIPGRFERIRSEPTVIFDVAHTEESVSRTMEILAENALSRGILIFGCCSDKEFALIARAVKPLFREIWIVPFDHPRCADQEELSRAFIGALPSVPIRRHSSPEDLLREKIEQNPPFILVMGSFFLLSRLEAYRT